MKKNFALALLAAFCSLSCYAEETCHCLSVTGQGRISVRATIAEVNIGVEAEGKTAQEVQQALANSLNAVLAKLKELQASRLETGTMNINPEYSNGNPPMIVKYRGRVEVRFQADATSAGEYIDQAISAGANLLNSITLKPSEAILQDARIAALQSACQTAMSEAKAVLTTLGLESAGIRQVNILEENQPHPFSQRHVLMAKSSENTTPVLEQEQSVSASVSLTLDLKTSK